MSEYSEYFINELKNRKYVITNSDIDGILSASLLCYYFPNLSLKGFTNSSTNVWVTDEVNKDNSLYIDIYMTNNNTFTVDNHIINNKLYPIDNKLKLNPNLIRGVTLENYSNKYPFSTFIFILHMLEEHFNVDFINLDKIIGTVDDEPLYLWELILRADDTLLNSYKYPQNTDDWWKWLCKNNNGLLLDLFYRVKFINSKTKAEAIKEKVKKFLLQTFNLKTDGYKSINDNMFEPFLKFISENFGYELSKPKNLNNFNFNLCRYELSNPNESYLHNIPETYNVLSLSFVSKKLLSYSFKNKL
jgi:hypothetical protein